MRLPAFGRGGGVNSWRTSIGWTAAFAAALFGIKLWLIGTYGNATPFWDQWDAEAAFLYQPFLEGRLGWADLLAPHNEHRILTTRLLALALLEANGSWNPILQMVVNAALHVTAIVLILLLLVPAIGHARLPIVLAFALALFGLPTAWENTLAGFQSGFYFVLLFSVAAMWLTVLAEPLSPRWWSGVAFAVLAFLSLASGVFAVAAAAGIGMIQYALGIRRTRAQAIAIVVLLALFGVGLALTGSNPGHEPLKAASAMQFAGAMAATLSWPLAPSVPAAIVRNLPIAAFGLWLLWRRPAATDARWFLAALVLLALAQAASVAYGRAVGVLAPRYTDLFALAVLAGFLCFVVLSRELPGSWRTLVPAMALAGVAAAAFHFPVAQFCSGLLLQLDTKRATSLAQEANVRSYLATGDMSHLTDKPHLQVPYPSPERLAAILASPKIRSILPPNIQPPMAPSSVVREPVAAGKLASVVDRLLASWAAFIVLGFAVALGMSWLQRDDTAVKSPWS